MRNEYLSNISENEIKKGIITFRSSFGKECSQTALMIPGYGLVSCAMRLREDFTTNPDDLVIVKLNPGDDGYDISDIWVSRTTSKIIAKVELW